MTPRKPRVKPPAETPEQTARRLEKERIGNLVVKRKTPRLWMQAGQNVVSELVRRIGDLHVPRPVYLPPFQRPYVWTPEQAASFLNRLMHGVPFGPTLLVERFDVDRKWWSLVLDGQQRLTTVGATVYRADGSENEGHTVVFDCDAWEWTADPARRTRWTPTPRELLDADWMWAAWKDLDDMTVEGAQRQYDLATASDVLGSTSVTHTRYGCDAPEDAILEAFIGANTGGTPWDADALDAVRRTLRGTP